MITHYFPKISVAVLKVTDGEVTLGDEIRIGEEEIGLLQMVESMQVDHAQVNNACCGNEVGLKVNGQVHEGDVVYKNQN